MVNNPPVRIFINKIENRITFDTKTGYYQYLLSPETMKLHDSTKHRITEDTNRENVPHFEITKVILAHYNIITNDYRHDWKVLYALDLNKSFNQLLDVLPKA